MFTCLFYLWYHFAIKKLISLMWLYKVYITSYVIKSI